MIDLINPNPIVITLTERKNILIIGSGGREHAIGWKLSHSNFVNKIFYAPGNGGTINNTGIHTKDFIGLIKFAKENNCITIVGPEEPLTLGIVNDFHIENLLIFGPTKETALLESSKAFAKEFMKKNNIPTANFSIFSDPIKAKDFVTKNENYLVIKADGLASGKGVIVCDSKEEAISSIDRIMIKKEFGEAGNKIVIEEKISGDEISFIGLSDGNTIIPLETSQDHKRAFDNDEGPNTGGMGSFSPSPLIDNNLHEIIMKNIMIPTINALKVAGTPYIGFLYAGLMIDKLKNTIHVLEFNVRLGDPECQPLMMRMKSDLYPYIVAAINGELSKLPKIEWRREPAVCVVMVENGYPVKYNTGNKIEGIRVDEGIENSEKDIIQNEKVVIFHAGTRKTESNEIVTDGGRILGITAIGETFENAIDNAYKIVKMISSVNANLYYRKDIGKKAIKRI